MPVRLPFRPRRDAYPPDLWTKCPGCTEMLFNKQLDKTLRVCPHCGHHFRISAKARIEQLVDPGSFVERDADLTPVDALGFVDLKTYPDRLMAAQLATGLRDARCGAWPQWAASRSRCASWTSASSAARWAPWWARRWPEPARPLSPSASRS